MSDLKQVASLIESGKKQQARQILLEILQRDRNNEQAWLYMAACAQSKAEFVTSVQRVLEMNPNNNQAIKLAQKYDIHPAHVDPHEESLKRRSRRTSTFRAVTVDTPKKKGGGARVFLLLLILLVVIAGGAFVFLSGGDDGGEEVVSENATEEAGQEVAAVTTEEALPEPTEELMLPTEEALPEPTEELMLPTEEALPEPTEELILPTEEALPEPTEELMLPTEEALPPAPQQEVVTEPTEEALPPAPQQEVVSEPTEEITPEPTEEVIAEPTSEFPIEANMSDYLFNFSVLAGTGETVSELLEVDIFIPQDDISPVVDVKDHGEILTVRVILQLDDPDVDERRSDQIVVPAGASDTIIFSFPPEDGWTGGTWTVRAFINGDEVATQTIEVIDATVDSPEATPEEAPTEVVTTPTEVAESPEETPATTSDFNFENSTLSLVYDDLRAYLLNYSPDTQNVSDLRFVQTIADGEVVFEALAWVNQNYRGPGSPYQLRTDGCLQVGTEVNAASLKPVDCLRLISWRELPVEEAFWLPVDDSAENFQIFLGDELITTCEFDANSCFFALPE